MGGMVVWRGFSREAKGAIAAAGLIVLYFALYAVATFSGTYVQGKLGILRIAISVVWVATVLAYTQVFYRQAPKLCTLFIALFLAGIALYWVELAHYGLNVRDFSTQALPVRMSQVVQPTAYVILGIVMWKNKQVPRILALGMFAFAAVWYLMLLVNGQVDLQLGVAMAVDITSFLVFSGLVMWLLLYWHAEYQERNHR